MKESRSFLAVSVAIVLAGTLAGSILSGDARTAIVAAGLVVLVTQFPLHFLLRGWRERNDRFLASIVVGFFVRVAVLAVAVVVFVVPDRVAAAPFLLALGGFMVGILIAEATFESRRLRTRSTKAAEAQAS